MRDAEEVDGGMARFLGAVEWDEPEEEEDRGKESKEGNSNDIKLLGLVVLLL